MSDSPRNIPSAGLPKMITWLGIILLVNISFLFSPRPDARKSLPEDICIESYIHINRYMGFPVNCDAISFISPAIEPSILFQQGYIRQSRPAYILLGTIAGYAVYYISYPLHPWLGNKLKSRISTVYPEKSPHVLVLYTCFYLAFILINIALLLITFLLFEKITLSFYGNSPPGAPVLPLMLVLLVSTPLCKAFFWTVHQQLFNILMPVLALYIGLRLTQSPKKYSALLLIAFLSGFLVLFYGNAVLLLPIICFCYLKGIWDRGKNIPSQKWLRLAGIIPIFFSTTILWILLLHLKGISIYNNEITVAREFVWMTDLLHSPGSFWKEFTGNTMAFLQTLPTCGFPSLVLLIVLIGKKKEVADTLTEIGSSLRLQKEMIIIVFTPLLFLLFYWLMGFYATRLTAALPPFIIYATALLLVKQQPDRKFTILLLLAVIGIHLYTLFSYGPFS